MNYLIMDWYNKFECIAGACAMTCCTTEWKILVDDETYETYKKMDTQFGKWIADNIDPKQKCFKAGEADKKCSMLDDGSLCEIVKQLGAEYLCKTCKLYPRQMRSYGEIQEWSVDITCPVVAEYLLSGERIGFSYVEKDEEKAAEPCDYAKYQALSYVRTFCVELLQERADLPLAGRLYIMKQIHDEVRQLKEADDITMDHIKKMMQTYENPLYLEEMALQVEKLHKNPEMQYTAILDIIMKLNETGESRLVSDTLKQCQNLLRDKETFISLSERFTAWCKKYERVYENFFVYHLFLNFIDMKELGSCFERAALEFLFIQLFAMEAWNRQKLTKECYRDIIAGAARKFERGFCMQEKIVKLLREYSSERSACVLFWLLI